jgi:pyridoxal phosphate enzyme (YggS family)
VVELIHGLDPARVATNLARVREQIAAAAQHAGREPAAVRVLAATKYLAAQELPTLAAAGVDLVGESRAQDLQAKAAAHRSSIGGLAHFEWHFIGALQSRRVRAIVPHVSLIHSLASHSALRELQRHRTLAHPGLRVLIQVNLAREPGKAGIAPEELDAYLERSPFPVAGLMTMPPLAAHPEDSRRWFAELRQLAATHGLAELSMGTSQDFPIAVQEGATIVRIGTRLYR